MQVHVTDHRASGHSPPVRVAPFAHEAVDVDRVGGHEELIVAHLPAAARAIGVDLDAESVGVVQVERFADEVIALPGANGHPSEVRHEPPQVCACGEEDGKVIEAEASHLRRRRGARHLVQFNEDRGLVAGAERGVGGRALEHAKAEDLLIVGQRPREIGDVELHASDPGGGRKPVARGGGDPALSAGGDTVGVHETLG